MSALLTVSLLANAFNESFPLALNFQRLIHSWVEPQQSDYPSDGEALLFWPQPLP